MRFISPDSRPSLTPLGHRLLSLSERKLATLDGAEYDEGHALRKGLLVRQAVRSAWQSVEDGSVAELTDWHKHGALGLDVLTEEDEDDFYDRLDEAVEENNEARWFENLVSGFGDDEAYLEVRGTAHEWVESSVSMPELEDDLEYDAGTMVAFELPLPTSPTSLPSTPAVSAIASTASVDEPLEVTATEVQVQAVEDEEEGFVVFHDAMTPRHHWPTSTSELEHFLPTTPIIFGLPSPPLLPPQSSPLPHPSPLQLNPLNSASSEFLSSLNPLQSSSEFLSSPYPYPSFWTEFEEYVDEFSLPPPLLRSMSSSTTSSLDDEDEVCATPPLRSVELDSTVEADDWDTEEKVLSEARGVWRGLI